MDASEPAEQKGDCKTIYKTSCEGSRPGGNPGGLKVPKDVLRRCPLGESRVLQPLLVECI